MSQQVPQRERIKTLEEILRNSPEARAYAAELRQRRAPDPTPEFDTPTCAVCGGLGWITFDVRFDHPQFGKAHPCPNPTCPTLQAMRTERYAKLCTLSQIPAEYQGEEVTFAGWAELEQHETWIEGKRGALGAALAFIAARERAFKFTLEEAAELGGIEPPEFSSHAKCSLVFTGKNGVGKTSLAVSIARHLLDSDVQVIYIRFAEFFDGLKERFKPKASYEYGGEDADDEAEYMRQYQQAPVLVLDEFYAEATPWRKERAESLVNHRYTHQLPTIVTTNLDADTLTHHWGLTTGHRLQAMSHWVVVGGKELRPRAEMWAAR
jgi:hypothetical protein